MNMVQPAPNPAAAIGRGVTRLLFDMGFDSLPEFTLGSGRRADVIWLDTAGRFTIVEVKSSVADFRSDRKWHEYRDYCDAFYFAVDRDFPIACLPEDCGLMIADPFEAAIVRPATACCLNGSRRKAQTLRFALIAARRLALPPGVAMPT